MLGDSTSGINNGDGWRCGSSNAIRFFTNPSLPVYEFDSVRAGILKYGIKEFLQWTSPGLACKFFTYHCSVVCRKG